jgi:hypothetical protein
MSERVRLLYIEDDFNYDISFMAARLVPEKGIMDLLEIVREVQQKKISGLHHSFAIMSVKILLGNILLLPNSVSP